MHRVVISLVLSALLCAGPAAAWAQPAWREVAQQQTAGRESRNGSRQRGRQSSHLISPRQAARRAQRRFGGRVLSVELEHRGGSPVYRVKLLSGGVVRVVRVPAAR